MSIQEVTTVKRVLIIKIYPGMPELQLGNNLHVGYYPLIGKIASADIQPC